VLDALRDVMYLVLRNEELGDFVDTTLSLMYKLDDTEVEAIRRGKKGNLLAAMKNHRNWALRHEICWKLRQMSPRGERAWQRCVR